MARFFAFLVPDLMLNRLTLVALAAFWATMTVLLWRAEYGGRAALGSSVPARVVWEKILTAPDSSSLTILHKGKKIGFCHWITSVSEDLSKLSGAEAPPEGMVRKIVNYRLELDGNVMVGGPSERLRFDTHLSLGKGEQWRDFDAKFNLRPSSWELKSSASDQVVHLTWQDDPQQKFSRDFTFAELQHPQALVEELAGPLAGAAVAGLLPTQSNGLKSLDLNWKARLESIRLGHSAVRAYRLETRMLDRFAIVLFVSRVGEILRVELPDGIVFTNDQLGGN
ncbi:MAG TPA: hypothetical protein VL793_09255 [Patescibacteria group bacterium]|nr:hypothetical protein [Patescibacteria group bacterium]